MSILPVTLDDVEAITAIINPVRTYSSGTTSGVTGSIQLFPRASSIEKEVRPLSNFESSTLVDDDIEGYREDLAAAAVNIVGSTGSLHGQMDYYMSKVNEQSFSAKKAKQINVLRFTPSFSFTSNTLRKLNVKDILMPFYTGVYPSADWAYTNYNCLSFFTASTLPTSSVLLYPSVDNPDIPSHVGYVSGAYSLSGSFSFDFRINPRYRSDTPESPFHAGTIFHLSSSYALSLVTGSNKDINGFATGYRLLLQLSHSADIPPSQATQGSYPNDLVFYSDDNSLEWNKWHRVVVRWGTDIINDGTGSFNIDGVDKGIFVVPSGTIMPKVFSGQNDPDVLCVGNFYEGSNDNSFNSQAHFFADVPSSREGVAQLIDNGATQDEPVSYAFNHPLNADLHELIIRRNYMTNYEIGQTKEKNIVDLNTQNTAFYVPPMFVEKTNIRKFTNFSAGSSYGGILQTPFFEVDGSTDDPFNVAMSFGVGGHYINLENFVKDFANNNWPRLHHLSGTAIAYSTQARPANEFLYDDPFVIKRNLLIMPCDDGGFFPDYGMLSDQIGNKYVDKFGRYDPSLINLDNLLNQSSLLFGETYDSDSNPDFLEQQIGFSPENPGNPPGPAITTFKNDSTSAVNDGTYGPGVQKNAPLVIYQRTKDPSSNQVTFFDISNLFYGSRILPGTFELKDINLSGSAGKLSILLKDDGFGNIYRADSQPPHALWNSVGNIFYNEGVVVIKSPHLYFFGKEKFEMSFKGEYQMHSLKYEILAPSSLLNSSSNPSYAPLKETIRASSDPIDNDVFVYISGMNLHDENLNVVAKAVLAQPVIKRENEKILFKVAFDF